MVHEENTYINMKLEKNLIFKAQLGFEKLKELIIDETLDVPEDQLVGPDATRLLGMAIMACMSTSLQYCLNKRNLSLDDLEAKAEISFKKIEGGYTRVDKVLVKLIPKTDDPEIKKRLKQCIRVMKSGNMMFEENCIITSSVREGINVDVSIEL